MANQDFNLNKSVDDSMSATGTERLDDDLIKPENEPLMNFDRN